MKSFLLENKWWILLFFETIAWVSTFYMAYARYWLKSNVQFILSGTIAIITGYIPHITLAVWDYQKYGKFHFFGAFVIILLILGVTLFNKFITKIDNRIKEWAKKKTTNN